MDKGVQIVRISDLGDDFIDSRDSVFYEEKDELSSFIIPQNCFLICMTGSIGKMAFVNDAEKRYLNQRVGAFIPQKGCAIKYLWFFNASSKKGTTILSIIFFNVFLDILLS